MVYFQKKILFLLVNLVSFIKKNYRNFYTYVIYVVINDFIVDFSIPKFEIEHSMLAFCWPYS